jgi:hypothetical protein
MTVGIRKCRYNRDFNLRVQCVGWGESYGRESRENHDKALLGARYLGSQMGELQLGKKLVFSCFCWITLNGGTNTS